MNIVDILKLYDSNEIHQARLMILLKIFSGKNNMEGINGITKLIKLDFLLRYPKYFNKALKAKNIEIIIDTNIYELNSVESKMIRYLYGPWDDKYRQFLNILLAKNLIWITIKSNTTYIGLTDDGNNLSNKLIDNDNFIGYIERASILKKYFDISGSNLKKFIYDTFPEITELNKGEVIE